MLAWVPVCCQFIGLPNVKMMPGSSGSDACSGTVRRRSAPMVLLLALVVFSACGLPTVSLPGMDRIVLVDPPAPAGPPVPCYMLGKDSAQAHWVDSVLRSMSVEQRIGQLFMVAAYSNKGAEHEAALSTLVREQHVGGLIFFQGGPLRQLRMTNRLQALARVPLMIGIDGEWGLQMRLQDSTLAYPRQMTLGAHPSEELIERMGTDIARQCRRMGIQINFAPVVDVNSNPANPVIGMRSFGENRENVALKAAAYMRGMQRGHILACAKHFPGHGDTDADSHFSLPLVKHSRKQMEETDLYPFRKLMADSLASVMVAHLFIPSLDKTANRPSTLSKAITTDLLRKQMGFGGLAFTDALNMAGAAKYAPPGQLDLQALLAGNDVLLFPEDVPAGVAAIKAALDAGKLKADELDLHVRRILTAKYWAGLTATPPPLVETNLYQDLHTGQTKALVNACYRAAVTFVRNERKLLPFKNLDTMEFAAVAVGDEPGNAFQRQLARYAAQKQYGLPAAPTAAQLLEMDQKLGAKRLTVVVSLHKISAKAGASYGLSADMLAWLRRISAKHRLVVVAFGNPYALKLMNGLPTLVCAYEDNAVAQAEAAQALFGAGATGGRLPVSLAANSPEGTGKFEPDAHRLGFGEPEEVGLDSRKLARLDTIASYVASSRIAPGCQLVVARRGKVIYQKNFGVLNYVPDSGQDAPSPVTDSTIYDLASITKAAGTLQAVMFLQERGLLDLSQTAGYYLPELAGYNKENLVLADILAHQAGLVPTLPHWERTLVRHGRIGQRQTTAGKDRLNPTLKVVDTSVARQPLPQITSAAIVNAASAADSTGLAIVDSLLIDSAGLVALDAHNPAIQPEAAQALAGFRLNNKFYCTEQDQGWYTNEVRPGLYAIKTMEDTLWHWTVASKLLPRNSRGGHDYLYSDVGYYILKRIAERLLNQPVDEFVAQNLYAPLGLQTMGYHPLARFSKERIAPTEYDQAFRKALIRGTVHDPGAAMIGGVGGHAGLFSNALDLAVLMQMNMQAGEYGGQRYLQAQTVPYFARAHFRRNRRGLGWDKPLPTGGGPTGKLCSPSTFGHTGFTGTCAWADPEEEIVFIFLSNRVCPDADNKRLINENIRPILQDIVYRAILDTTLEAGVDSTIRN